MSHFRELLFKHFEKCVDVLFSVEKGFIIESTFDKWKKLKPTFN